LPPNSQRVECCPSQHPSPDVITVPPENETEFQTDGTADACGT
jgi:hypothetical protein